MQSMLILDDESSRHYLLARRWPQFKRVHVYDVPSALLVIGVKFDLMLLDYDLGSGHLTGDEFVQEVVRLPPASHPGMVVVHTGHAEAGKRMVRMLRTAGIDSNYEPFNVEAA